VTFFDRLGRLLIRGYDDTADPRVRLRHGYLAGWASILVLFALFAVRLWLGLAADAVSIVAISFTLLSDLLASVVLVASFWISGRPATARTPFGHGRMEQVAPLLISFILFFLGLEVARESLHSLSSGHEARYWALLPWIVLGTAAVKRVLGGFVLFLGRRVQSHAIEESAAHLKIEGMYSLAVVAGLVLGHYVHLPWLDGAVGLAGALAILYLSYRNARHALEPLLGQAPPADFLASIRAIAAAVPEVRGVHEIVVHSYGHMRIVSLHAEIPESHTPARAHQVAEILEHKLRTKLGGDIVVHTDPLMARTPEVEAIEARFRAVVDAVPGARGFSDFRLVAHSPEKIIIVADLEVDRELGDAEREAVLEAVREGATREFPELAYGVFHLMSRFGY